MNKHFEEYARYLEQAYGSRYTSKPMESGYLTHDGRWLKMGVDGNRADDHRGVAGIIPIEDRMGSRWPSVVAWMRDTKSIRWMPENCGFDIHFKPTKEQLDAILDMLRLCGELQVEQTSDSQNATEIFEYKRGGATKLKKFISDFWGGKFMSKNPKLPIQWKMLDGSPFVDMLRSMVSEASKRDLIQLEKGIPLNFSRDGGLAWWGAGKELLLVRPLQGDIWVRNIIESPTVVHVLKQISDNVPEWEDLKLFELQYIRGDDKMIGDDTEETLGSYAKKLKRVTGSFTRTKSRGVTETKDYDFVTVKLPSDVDWYHATTKKNLASIKSRGLLPSLEATAEGWTQLNFDLQKAVYLTSDLSYAANIAETLALRSKEDAVVLRIKGRALNNNRLVADEDALRDDMDGSVNYNAVDPDFPAYATSMYSQFQSIASLDPIPARDIDVVLTATYTVDEYDYRDEPVREEIVEFSGSLAGELKSDDDLS